MKHLPLVVQEEAEVEAQMQGELNEIESQIKALDAQLGSQSPGRLFECMTLSAEFLKCKTL